MTIADALPVVGIVLLGAALFLFFYFAFKAYTVPPKAEARPAWDGKHTLRGIKHVEHFGNRPEDYSTGWLWECACGIGNKYRIGFDLPYTEGEAIAEYKEHRDFYKGMQEDGSSL